MFEPPSSSSSPWIIRTVWHEGIHNKCLETIKAITSQKLLLRPINHTSQEPVWVVCDACPSGCGAYYGQGEDWKTMRPAGFMSKKFTDAQGSYFTYEHKMLGAIEALKKWDDELLQHHSKPLQHHSNTIPSHSNILHSIPTPFQHTPTPSKLL